MLNIAQYGKYRAVIISIAMFIFLDAGVLILNYYIASQISEDAVNVNLAGRQRMLSQKSVKALYDYQTQIGLGYDGANSFEEFRSAVDLFDQTLLAFDGGGETTNPAGDVILLEAAETSLAKQIIKESLYLWSPLKQQVETLSQVIERDKIPEYSKVIILVELAKSINIPLLGLMNDLTNELEAVARQKSETLRLVQTIAICLAVLNFFLILFHFIGQLRKSDAVVEEARKETSEILQNVREGLFLLDDKLTISGQYSSSVKAIFGSKEYSGKSFRSLLKSVVTSSELDTSEEYIKLLLNKDVKERLIETLNPLIDIEVNLEETTGVFTTKHLSFRFKRTIEQDMIRHILVTVLDVTESVELRRELARAQQSHGLQLDVIKKISHLNNTTLSQYLVECQDALLAVNEVLKEKTTDIGDYRNKISSIYRIMHKIKGDAGVIDLTPIAEAAHRFEEQLEQLKNQTDIRGNDFLPVTLALKEFMTLVSDLMEIARVFDTAKRESGTVQPAGVSSSDKVERLVQSMAARLNKHVVISFIDFDLERLAEDFRSLVSDCVIQLARNSVAHGIEEKTGRELRGKAIHGHIAVSMLEENGGLRVKVRDDGAGIDLEKLRTLAVSRGVFTDDEAKELSANRLTSLIFEPGFSTVDIADTDAGRGVGMDLVRANINKMQGRIRVSSKKDRYCEISFWLPEASLNRMSLKEAV